MSWLSRLWPALAIPLGVGLGLGLFTFGYAEGFSYLGNAPATCANCHIMNEQYDGWVKGPHEAVATCNDCHTPHDLVGKYTTKALNGYHHSKAFTAQDFAEPIAIKPANSRILQDSCLSCHGELVHQAVAVPGRSDEVRCVHCHLTVGHGERAGLGGPRS